MYDQCTAYVFMFNPLLPLLPLFVSQQFVSYTCQVSGPGLKLATTNQPTQVIVELREFNGRLCSLKQNVTAQLELLTQDTQTNQPLTTSTRASKWPWFKKVPKKCAAVARITPSQYKVLYTAVSRGQNKLHVQVNDREINGSPFIMTVYPDPTQLGHPVRIVTDLIFPYGITYNSLGEMIVSEWGGHRISIIDNRGQKIRTFGSIGDSPDQMKGPTGIAIDDANNIYVSSEHKLQKFTSNGELIQCIGQKGGKEGEFNDPHGVSLHDNQVYVCDSNNHRIQVFDQNLNFVRCIGSRGKGRGEFNEPWDVKLDTAGNMYVADYNNGRVQVLDSSGHFIRAFGEEGERKLGWPSGLYIADKYVYVSNLRDNCIVIYDNSGQFVTSFGRGGENKGEFNCPFCITSCVDGFIHVCDYYNNRIQIF